MWFSSNSELLGRWLISSPEAKKEESRSAKACGCYIENTHLCMAFSVQLNGWTTSAVESGLTVRWSSDSQLVQPRSVFTVCCCWATEGWERDFCWHGSLWNSSAASDMVSPWEKKSCKFFVTNHQNSLFLSSWYQTGVGLMECASEKRNLREQK